MEKSGGRVTFLGHKVVDMCRAKCDCGVNQKEKDDEA